MYTKLSSSTLSRILKIFSEGFVKGIVHFEINFWYLLAYLKGIFVSTLFSILIFFGQTVLVYQS